jgi:two-component sensor histidine kinase/ligand-binding sensor domain-containing protein
VFFIYYCRTYYLIILHKPLFSLILLSNFFSLVFYAQENSKFIISHRTFSVEDGLASREVVEGLQDARGFVWLATRNGLNYYDGKNFRLFTERNGMQTRRVVEMVEDDTGFLWLNYGDNGHIKKGSNKLDLMNIVTKEFIPFDKKFPDAPFKEKDICSVISNGKGGLFILIDLVGAYFYSHKTGFVFYSDKIRFTLNFHTTMIIAHENSLVNGFSLTHPDLYGKEQQRTIVSDSSILFLNYEGNDTWEAILTDNSKRKFVYTTVSLKNGLIYSSKKPGLLSERLLEDSHIIYNSKSNTRLLVTPGKALQLYRNHQFIMLDTVRNKNENAGFIRSYFIDSQNKIWVCTNAGVEIYELKKNYFTAYFTEQHYQFKNTSSTSNQTRGIYADNKHNVWVQEENLLLGFNDSTKKTSIYPSLANETIYALIPCGNQLVFGNTKAEGFEIENPGRNFIIRNHINYPRLDGEIWSMMYLGNNRVLCGRAKGIEVANLKRSVYEDLKCAPGKNPIPLYVYQMFRDKNAKLFAACENGLFQIDSNGCVLDYFSTEVTDKTQQIPFNNILHVYNDYENNFWLATNGDGLYKWDRTKNTFKHFTVAEGLSSNVIYRIESDNHNNLWMSSDYGLMRFNLKDYSVKTFTTKDGLTNNEFNRVSSFKANDGRLFFGGLNGLVGFYPSAFAADTSTTVVPLMITSFSQFSGKENRLIEQTTKLLTENKIVLQPSDGFFTIEFQLLDYEQNVNRYAYKIAGIDKDWNYINENNIRISGLPFGQFTMQIKGQSQNGHWSKSELAIPLIVLKPFYLQWWFVALFVLALIISIFLFIRSRTKRLLNEQTRLKNEVEKQTLYLNDALTKEKELLNEKEVLLKEVHHRVKNNLQVISGLLELQSKTLTDMNAKEALIVGRNRVRSVALIHHNLYQFENLGAIELHTFANDLHKQLNSILRKENLGVSFENTIPHTEIDIDTAVPLGLILNELITNSYKYAFAKNNEASISIHLIPPTISSEENYTLIYKDNGIGLSADMDLNKTKTLGLRLIADLTKQLKGTVKYTYENGACFSITFKDKATRKKQA